MKGITVMDNEVECVLSGGGYVAMPKTMLGMRLDLDAFKGCKY